MAERVGTRGDDWDAARGDGHDRPPGPLESASAVPTTAELCAVNEGLLIAGLREQELATALEAERAQLAAILASIGDAVAVVDRTGTPLRTNAAYAALAGGEGATLALYGEDGQPLSPAAMPRARAARGETFSLEASLLQPDGTRRWVEANGQPLQGTGAEQGVVVIRDITAASLHRRLQDEFLATASHQLQTPLTAARAALILLQAGTQDQLGPDERELLEVACHNIERLRVHIADLLAANQLDADALHVERAVLDVRGIIAPAVEGVLPLLRAKGQTLALDLPEPLPALGDPRWLEQALVNLLANAHRHTPTGTRITISGRTHATEVLLVVRDTGPGVPAAEQNTIFERFHGRGQAGGSGLGLAIVRAIVARHEGRVWVESGDGEGAAFHLTLPRPQTPEMEGGTA